MLGAGPDNAERFYLFGLRLYVPVNFYSVMLRRFPGLNNTIKD